MCIKLKYYFQLSHNCYYLYTYYFFYMNNNHFEYNEYSKKFQLNKENNTQKIIYNLLTLAKLLICH